MRTLTYFPQSLIKEELDLYLAKGYFRSRDMMYHSPIAFTDDGVFSVVRTRLPLKDHTFRKSQRKLINKCNKAFRYEFAKIALTAEKEALYQIYKSTFKGNLADTLEGTFVGSFESPFFDTYEISIYDDDRLIATSYYDIGKESMASIMGIYHPDYAAYSLGIFTMYIEVIEAQLIGLKYYYAGYILPGNNRFQYKERLGDLECIDEKGQWSPLKLLDRGNLLVEKMLAKLGTVESALKNANIPFQRYQYPLYDLAYRDTGFAHLFKNIFFILIGQASQSNEFLCVEYHHRAETFILNLAYIHRANSKKVALDLKEMYSHPDNWLHLVEVVKVIKDFDEPEELLRILRKVI